MPDDKPDGEDVEVRLDRDASKTAQLNIRIRKGQLAFWEEASAMEGIPLPAWIKQIVTQEAARVFAMHDPRYGSGKRDK
jgi:hypothetical protein